MDSCVRRFVAVLSTVVLACFSMGGCESNAQTGGLVGAGIGAIAGQAIGGNTAGTVIGTAVGGGLGYVIGNEQDKEDARRQTHQTRESYRRSRVSEQPATVYRPAPANRFVGTTWRVVSLVSDRAPVDYASIVVTFQTNERITTLITYRDGGFETEVESYRVVGDTMVINGPDYMINAEYAVHGDELIISAPNFRAVMERVDG